MKKVLIITNSFLPDKRGRAEKMATRASFFLKNGWEPVIFMPRHLFSPRYSSYGIDDEANIRVYRYWNDINVAQSRSQRKKNRGDSFSGNFKSSIPLSFKQRARILFPFMYFPDAYSRWIIPGIIIGSKIVDREKISLVNSMNNPVSLHLIAYGIKLLKGIPWIAEFRDPWVGNPRTFYEGKPDFLSKLLERATVNYCDKLILYDGFHPGIEYFHKAYPAVEKHKFKELPYIGYVPEYFDEIKPVTFNSFTITYAGSFHRGGRGPDNFFKALSGFIDKCHFKKGNVRVNFLGFWDEEYSNMVRKLNLSGYVFDYGWMPHREAVSILKGSNVCLYINRGLKGDESNVSQKVFDYVGAKRPILALTSHNCKINQLIRTNNLGIIADKDSVPEIQLALERTYKCFREGISLFDPSAQFLASLDRKKVIGDFCSCMDELVEKE